MTDKVDSHVPSLGAVVSIQSQFLEWLMVRALPLWDEYGVDRGGGGYFETLTRGSDQTVLQTGSVRRGRVVARQIYVFDIGRRIGWRSRFTNPVEHGCEYLFSHLHDGDGLFHTAVLADTRRPVEPFNLYEQAFYLFALARLPDSSDVPDEFRNIAVQCLTRLRAGWGRAGGGFEETIPRSLPLRSNPHMHLLEAALAWLEVSEGAAREPWLGLGREIVNLCLTYFVDANTGALREYFDFDWQPASGESGRIVEPGHQFEWAWLLLEWASLGEVDEFARRTCVDTALRLMEVGERWGVDRVRGVTINEIWADMRVKDSNAKLWPQTERVKAWCARLANATSAANAEFACQHLVKATSGLWQYLGSAPPGLWHEVRSSDGSFVQGASKASSLYHVVCAIDVLRRTVAALRPRMTAAWT